MKKILAGIMIVAGCISALSAVALGCCYLRDLIVGVRKFKTSLQSKSFFRGTYEDESYE